MLKLLGQPMLIINSLAHATELLEKRSALYSDRPHFTMAGEIVGWDQILVLLRYGSQFREYRRLMARALGSRKTVETFAPVIEAQSAQLLVRLLRDARDIPGHLREYVPRSALSPPRSHAPHMPIAPANAMGAIGRAREWKHEHVSFVGAFDQVR